MPHKARYLTSLEIMSYHYCISWNMTKNKEITTTTTTTKKKNPEKSVFICNDPWECLDVDTNIRVFLFHVESECGKIRTEKLRIRTLFKKCLRKFSEWIVILKKLNNEYCYSEKIKQWILIKLNIHVLD